MYQKRFRKIITSKTKQILNSRDKERVKNFLLHEKSLHVLRSPASHKMLWLKTSGALARMQQNPGYYESLKQNIIIYPTPLPAEIEKDVKRTFGSGYNPERLEKDISCMRNVLNAYGMRNPIVGYC